VESAATGRMTVENTGTEALQHLFLLRIENGRGMFHYLPALAAGQKVGAQLVLTGGDLPLERLVDQIGKALGQRLVQEGLFSDEAQAMVNTWSRSYFRTEGTRVLYLVPRAQIDQTLPLQIQAYTPRGAVAPTHLERVFVGRVECLTPEEEARIETWLRDLGSSDAGRAAAARAGLVALGRFAEPHLQRALQESPDPVVRASAQALLNGDALDELTAAERAFPDDPGVKARHAALDRRAGLADEAKAEGQTALTLLQSHAPSTPKNSTAMDHVAERKWLRSVAFAREAIGDPGPAAAAYAEWIGFASGLKNQDCHTSTLVRPLSYSDLREWWGGERFRTFAQAAGQTDARIAAAQERLKTAPNDSQALLTLAYLLPARGEDDAAEQAWLKLEAGGN